MPIRFAPEPQNGAALVRAGLERLAGRDNHVKLTREDSQAAALESPHAVYDLRADEIAAGGGLETAHAGGFRYLVRSAGAVIAAAEVQADANGAATLLSNVNSGPYVQATAEAFEALPALEAVRKGSYEARLLRFSAIYLVAIWLKPDRGPDLVYPLAPAPPDLQAERAYPVEEFLNAIRPLARRRAERRDRGMTP